MKNIAELWRKIRRPDPAKIPKEEVILPYSVRYSLSYKEAELGKEELRELVEAGLPFMPAAIYLTMKVLNEDPEKQQKFLSRLVQKNLQQPNNIDVLKPIVLDEIAKFTQETHILGTKLAQFSRQGFEVWDERFRNSASLILQEDETPVLIAYSTLAGLPPFINTFKDSNNSIYILTPQWIQDQTNPFCGYRINTQAVDPVQLLRKDFQRPEKFILIRDTGRPSSEKIRTVWNFWNQEEREIDESKVRLLCLSN